jgi:formylglycine-generating enzyme required for sulfatase activity
MKKKIESLIIGLALLAGVHSAFAQVTNLGIAPAPGGQSVLYWPTSSTNYVLQTTTNLASPNWVTVRTAYPVNAGQVTNSAPSGFFRLQPVTVPAGMALVPAGWFTMGNSVAADHDITDAIPTNIYVSAFVMDVNLVSYGQWTNVYAYATSHGYNFVNAGLGKNSATDQPVQTVDWFDCVKWCNARSQLSGLTPVYYTDAGFTQVFTNGDTGTTVYQNLAANGFRLPTEAEWEKAARGGLSGRRFPWGNIIDENLANYYGNTYYSYDRGPNGYNSIGSIGGTSPATSPVGSFDVNGYGLYDMAGNVFEWCWDWYGTPYGQPSPINPTGAGPGSGNRVLRGGVWANSPLVSRCAFRGYLSLPVYANDGFGFRCVRGL